MFKIFVIAYLCLRIRNANANGVLSQKHAHLLRYSIKGVILQSELHASVNPHWPSEITVSINNGEYKGFVREDGRFVISSIPHGSYVLYVDHPEIYFPPVRVDITLRGKFRARQVNFVHPSLIVQIPYPLRLTPMTSRKYFYSREQWRIVDVILSPMFIVMAVPLVLMLMLPKLINDPEMKREMENLSLPKLPADLPDLSEMLTSLLSVKKPLAVTDKKPIPGKLNKKRK